MTLKQKVISIMVSVFCLLATGCATVEPYNYAQLQKEQPKSILVLPPVNHSVDVTASYSYLSTVSKPLAEKGYYVFPVSVIDAYLKENGLPTPAEMNAIPLNKIREHIGADAVLYVDITDWGQKYVLLSSNTIVSGKLKLISTSTGKVLWDSPFNFQQSSGDGGGGLVGALVGAVVEQIVDSITDQTPQVARVANNIAINQAKRGLLPGPYYSQAKAVNSK